MEGLFGEEFNIDLTAKSAVKKLVKKVESVKTAEVNTEKLLASKELSIKERLAIITEKVLKILGRQKENTVVIKTKEDFSAYIDKAIKAGRIDIDTETNNSTDPATCKIVGLCLYVPGEKQAYIPVNHVDVDTGIRLPWQMTEEDCKEQLQRILDSDIFIIMHNGKFDFEVLLETCGIAIPPDWDTIIGARLIDENKYSEKSTSLKWIYTTEIDPTQAKYDIESLFENIPYIYVDPEIFALYAATDSMMTDKVYLWELPYFQQAGNEKVLKLFQNIENPIVEVTAKMELRGVAVDLEFGERLKEKYNKQLQELDEKINQELDTLKDRIEAWRLTPEANEKTRMYCPKKSKMSLEKQEDTYNLVDEEGRRYKETKPKTAQLPDVINMASPTQLAILFYDVLKCPVVNKAKPRATGEDELVALAEQTDYSICKLIVQRRGIVKLISTYIDVIPELAKHWPDHRIRFKLNSMGTDTGRYSSGGKWKFLDGDKPVEISGINIQNIPSHNKEIRMLFRAKEDKGVVNFLEGVGETVKEIVELETPNGYVFVKELTETDKLFSTSGEIINISHISYNQADKSAVIYTDADCEVNSRTRYKLVGSDYSAQEPRLTAFISQDQKMIQAYEQGQDLYAVIAQSMYHNEYWENLEFYPEGTEIELDGKKIVCGKKTHLHKAGKERRASAKTMLLAATYGMSGKTAGIRLGYNGDDARKQGQQLLDNFFGKFTRVKEEIEASKAQLKKVGYVEDWAGRRRHLPEINLPSYTVKLKDDNIEANFNPFLNCVNKESNDDPRIKKWEERIKREIRASQEKQRSRAAEDGRVWEENDEVSNVQYEKLAKEALADGILLIANTGKRAQAERQCFNARIQGGAASLTKLAMINIDRDPLLNELDAHLVITVHDEVLVECPALYADIVEKRLPQVMIDTAKPYINVPMKCDPYNVSHWYEDEAAVAIREEFKKLEKGNPEKGIHPVDRETALGIIYDNHPEHDKTVLYNVITQEADLTF